MSQIFNTFRNYGKCGNFNGAIDAFSLGTNPLTQKYKDVELQLRFLRTEVNDFYSQAYYQVENLPDC